MTAKFEVGKKYKASGTRYLVVKRNDETGFVTFQDVLGNNIRRKVTDSDVEWCQSPDKYDKFGRISAEMVA